MKRVLKWTLLVALAAAVGFSWWAWRRNVTPEMDPVAGPLRIDAAALPAATHLFGDYRAEWSPEEGGSLRVFAQERPDRVIWETVPGAAFVAAGRGGERVTEARGSFFVRETRLETLNHQDVAAIDARGAMLEVRGRVRDAGGRVETPYVFALAPAGTGRLRFTLDFPEYDGNRSHLTCASTPGEAFFGFGEQFSYVNMKGRRLPIFIMEQGIGRGAQPLTFFVNLVARSGGDWSTTYAAAPQYITSAMRGLFLENHAYSVFDMRAPDRVHVELFEGAMRGQILHGHAPQDLITAYTEYAGRMRPLPDWILEGAVAGMQGGTARVRAVWDQLRAHDTPLAAFWLQDWVGQRRTMLGKQLWWNWNLDESHYPEWDQLLADLAAEDVRVMSYVNPFLADVAERAGHERDFFAEARERGYLVRRESGDPYLIQNTDFHAALLDLTNPDARDWMQDVIAEQLIASGVSGWMADFGEALPYDAVLHGDETPVTFHNRYPEVWAEVNRAAVDASDRADELVFFMRAGYRESPRHATLFWLGDQMVTWDAHDGIKTAVTGLLSSGFSGYAFNHSDIGGYTSVTFPGYNIHRSKELLLRWMELNAFTVVYRTHEGIQPDANVQFYHDDETLAHFSRMAKVYAAWAPYRKELVRKAAETGLPVVRHPFIHYPNDARFHDLRYELFLIGREFLVAPVLDPGVDRVEVQFPAETWVHAWTGRRYDGRRTYQYAAPVPAPLGKPAVFYREGSPVGEAFVAALDAQGL